MAEAQHRTAHPVELPAHLVVATVMHELAAVSIAAVPSLFVILAYAAGRRGWVDGDRGGRGSSDD